MIDKSTYLALDFGGTKLLIGELNTKGEVLNFKRYITGYVDQLEALEIIKQSVDDYISTVGWATEKKPVAIGIGVIGRVDNANGIWFQMDPKRNHPLVLPNYLTEKFGLPCFIDNDVKSAAKAEKLMGHGKYSDNFIFLNIGTGIAAGIVVNGQVVRGSHCNAGEVGHTSVGVSTGIVCGCGRKDCVELIGAGIGFDKTARLFQQKYSTKLSILDETIPVNVKEVYKLYHEGDELCQKLVELASEALANLIMNLVRGTDPDTVILGGGIVSDGFMYEQILKKLNPTTIRFVSNGVVLTNLDPNKIGLIGAGAVAMNIMS